MCIKLAALFACLGCLALPLQAAEPQVLILGTFHFANPGKDIHNLEAVDVLTDDAQRQIAAIADAIGRFEPTRVFVEWPENVVDERYAAYLDGSLAPSRNEVVQLGFRLAKAHGLDRIHGIDVEGMFPFQAVLDWAGRNGRSGEIEAQQARVAEQVRHIETLQREKGIAAALRLLNDASALRESHGMYMDLLRYGSGNEQPGAALNTAWFDRNIRTCARLLQALADGDRAVAIFGAGHAPWLRRCIEDTPGVRLVDALDYLPAH